ncbi:MAG: hypothetical protein PWR01_2323 [Clostridiales bacterium]|jgi:radical SAM-linked protein|nr:hypothetical protein [Clostridiales bacterium]MDN5281250.1 hypothetical protein [Candidatus Ozemobacter sp.]
MNETHEIKARVFYSKTKQACYIAHLDTIDIICKALRRLQLPYQVTQGHHVRPKISFGSPLPLGHASRCEQFVLCLESMVDDQWLKEGLSQQLPDGMDIISVELPCKEEKKGANGDLVDYTFGFTSPETAEKAGEFLSNPETTFSLVSKGRMKEYRLGQALQAINKSSDGNLQLINARFIQGKPEVPSVSKIVTALAEFLGEQKDNLVQIERVSLTKL